MSKSVSHVGTYLEVYIGSYVLISWLLPDWFCNKQAYEKCFENLHYVELHEDHTITQATQASYKKTKVYLWPAPTRVGVVAGRIVKAILYLAGFKNIRSKVIGSRNPYNTCKAVFKALNAVETPKDIQQKFGRAVVESRLLWALCYIMDPFLS